MRDYVIIIPENASECLQYCAEELNLFVNKTSGKNLDILSDNEFEEIMKMIQGSNKRRDPSPAQNNPMNRYGKRF